MCMLASPLTTAVSKISPTVNVNNVKRKYEDQCLKAKSSGIQLVQATYWLWLKMTISRLIILFLINNPLEALNIKHVFHLPVWDTLAWNMVQTMCSWLQGCNACWVTSREPQGSQMIERLLQQHRTFKGSCCVSAGQWKHCCLCDVIVIFQ